MKLSLPPSLLTLLLLLPLLTLLSVPSVLAFSYNDLVNVDGYQYSGCSGDGNFGYTNANYYVCDDNACGGGRLTVAPSSGGCFQSGVFFANRADVSLVAGPTPPPGFTVTPTPQPTPTPTPCPYTQVISTFQSGGDHASNSLTVAVGSEVGAVAVGVKANGQQEIIPEGKVRNRVTQNTAEDQWDPLFKDGADLSNPTGQFKYQYGGTYTLMSTPLDNQGNALETCVNNSVIGLAGLTVVGCPYKRTSVIIGDKDRDPFDFASYFEEGVDKVSDTDTVFCDYATAPGSCTAAIPNLATHTQKNLRLKLMRQQKDGVVWNGAPDGKVRVRRDVVTGAVEECQNTTDGRGTVTATCASGDGFVDYYLDPADTSLTALQSGGATDDRYTIEVTTLVEKNGKTLEIKTPACTDTEEIKVDACLYDSTQAYLRNKFAKPDEFKWTNNLFALRNDTVTFGAFHNFDRPETQSEPPFPTDTFGGLTGPYGINPLFGPGKLLYNPDERKLDLAGQLLNGEYRFDVYSNRVKDGATYKLDKSEFCTGTGTLKASTNACVTPAPATSLTKCCPTKPEGTNWAFNPLLRFLLTPFQSLPLRIKLGISRFETTTDTKKIADYFFGKDQEGQVDKGLYFKAAPPYEIMAKFPTETAEIQKRREAAKYSFNINNENQSELTSGPLENLPAAAFGAERIHKGWAARPLREEDLLATAKSDLAAAHGNVLGTTAPVCSEIRRTFVTENVCFTETEGAETNGAELNDFFTLAQGGLDNLLNLFADKLDWLEAYVRGGQTTDTTQPDSAAKRDTAYASGGLNKIFLRPGEEETTPPEQAGEAKANLVLGFQYKFNNEWRWVPEARVELPLAQAALRYLGGVKETVDFLRTRTLRPGEELPEEPLPSGTPTPTPTTTPTVTPIPPGNIPHTDTTIAITDKRKEDIMTYVETRWPASPIRSQWDYVYNTLRNDGYNPAFIIALWMEESGASGLSPYWDLGCGRGPQNNLPSQVACMNRLPYKNTSWAEFSCTFADGHYPCTFAAHPNFIRNLTGFYQCVTQSSCSLF